jgi:hypothetical protein
VSPAQTRILAAAAAAGLLALAVLIFLDRLAAGREPAECVRAPADPAAADVGPLLEEARAITREAARDAG